MLILVVERDPNVRELEEYFLKQAGFDVEFVASGTEALAMAQETSPDLIITEILVPELDGLALCRQLKEDDASRAMPILIFSVLSARVRAEEAGADAFLLKPLGERALVSEVRRLLGAEGPE